MARSRQEFSSRPSNGSAAVPASDSGRWSKILATSAASNLERCQCSCAGTEFVGVDPQSLEHREVEIAQRRGILRIEGQVPAMPEAPAGEKHRQVLAGMIAGVPQVAAEKDHRPVEQAFSLLFG